jgi:hypothetical protein
MGIDTTAWRLPAFVDHAVCRDDEEDGFLAARGIVPLRSDRPAAIGMQAKLEVHLFSGVDHHGWGVVTGPVTSVTREHLTATAVLTSDGSPLLDQRWNLLLARDPATFDGAWFAQRMTAEGVVTVPRRWPRMFVDELRVRGDLVCAGADVDLVCGLVRTTSTAHAALTTRAELAAFTARAVLRAFEREDRVDEIHATTDDLTSLLEELFAR